MPLPPSNSKTAPRLLWGGKGIVAKEKFTEDHSWSCLFHHQSPDRSEVSIKLGNKDYFLTSVTDHPDNRSKITEAGLWKKYRSVCD
jgi:hypothetical protein